MTDLVSHSVSGPDGEVYSSFLEAAAYGVFFNCKVSAQCLNFATCTIDHPSYPVLTAVPCCDRCAANVAKLEGT